MLLSQLHRALLKCRWVPAPDHPALDPDISGITADSRQVSSGELFIALDGHTEDGHAYVRAAVDAGACAVLVEREQTDLPVPQLVVPDSRLASAVVADQFYHHPSQQLRMIGVTGTNGKTTTTHLIEHILTTVGHSVGLIGTVGKRIAGHTTELGNTTPEAVDLQAMLADMVAAGCAYGVMEVSSHALDERRVAGVAYRIAVFTNLTQDHLDFHHTMSAYQDAKRKLFARLGNTYGASAAYAVINADDDAAAALRAATVMESVTYGIEQDADVRAVDVRISATGAFFHVQTFAGAADVALPLTGRFNVYNALAALAVGLVERVPLATLVQALGTAPGVPGRFERVEAGQPFTVLVDYSHTPDSLDNALQTVREFAQGRVLTVVGCGGDRDRLKRPLMAQMACRHSDLTILTSDNPRTEDPEAILDDMERGLETSLDGDAMPVWERVTDRRVAIAQAVAYAQAGDVVLIAGKGHETYQMIGRTKYHFDDREVAREEISRRVALHRGG